MTISDGLQIVIPMAGLGQRFRDAGFSVPKPLIPVSGTPMVIRAAQALPAAERYVFIVHPEHQQQYDLASTLRCHCPRAEIVVAPGLTQGQACTVALAAPKLNLEHEVLVAACDAAHLYDRAQFDRLREQPDIDAIIWTYRGDPRVLTRPQAYGWVRNRPGSIDVQEVSCKRPISSEPLNDLVISGTFWFRTAGLMCDGINELVASERRINSEFYLDVVPNLLLSQGRRVVTFEVDQHIGWGTPEDYWRYDKLAQYVAAGLKATIPPIVPALACE